MVSASLRCCSWSLLYHSLYRSSLSGEAKQVSVPLLSTAQHQLFSTDRFLPELTVMPVRLTVAHPRLYS